MSLFLMEKFANITVGLMIVGFLGLSFSPKQIAYAQAELIYKKYLYGTTSRECSYPIGRVDMNKIIEHSKQYPNPEIIIVTPQERRQIENEFRDWNMQGKQPRLGMDPCSTCSSEYEACVVYKIYEGSATEEKQCFEEQWRKWRDDWDQKVHKIIDRTLFQFTLNDPNYYQIDFPLRVGPDGRVVSWASPGGIWGGSGTAPQTWSKMANWMLGELKKTRAMPFPGGSRLPFVDRNPSLYHNIEGQEGFTSSPVPEEPCQ